jgi:two-component system cell cycle sensor histidine kinase/response regulator CckA
VILEVKLTHDLAPVAGDRSQLGQVLMNLAVNARDAMPEGGLLTIATSNRTLDEHDAARLELEPGAYVELTVADSGHGMDAETRARIFEPFFTTKAPGHGTGLGLAMIYGIVGQSGGAIDVESSPGEGTTFRVLLPVAAGAKDERRPATPAAPSRLEGATVLLVEDEPAVRKVVAAVLANARCRLLVANDGADAIALARSHEGSIDLLISDVVMPGMSGVELAGAVTATRPDARVLLVTGYASEAVSAHAETLGASLLEKPFTPPELLERITELLRAGSSN